MTSPSVGAALCFIAGAARLSAADGRRGAVKTASGRHDHECPETVPFEKFRLVVSCAYPRRRDDPAHPLDS